MMNQTDSALEALVVPPLPHSIPPLTTTRREDVGPEFQTVSPAVEAGREGLRIAGLTPVLCENHPPIRSRLLPDSIMQCWLCQRKLEILTSSLKL